IVCFMTDGYIGNETEILAAIEKKLGDDTRLFSFGVGSSVNRYLLERMADVGKGEVQYVLLNENPEDTVKRFCERVRNPVLTHIRVDWSDLDVSGITPARIKDLFVGQPIFVLGQYGRAGSATVKVRGKVGGKDVVYEIAVTLPGEAPENGALATLWARGRIRELMAEQYRGENKDVIEKITELALKYRLMSQYTSFVAVEEKVVNEGGEVKTIQVPVEMPEGVSYEGVFGPSGEQAPAFGAPFAMGVAAGGRGSGFGGIRGILPAKSAARRQVACEIAVDEERFGSLPADAPELRPFTIELKTAEGQKVRTVTVEASGDVWIVEADAATGAVQSRMLATRLRQSELRELWAWLSKALESDKPTALAHEKPGTLTVRILAEGGTSEKDILIALDPNGTASESWQRVVDYVLKAAR
ncbi:MAG: hypothetical protein JXB04_01425, partial [Kiritimatiellae bacterium]|nr:hypothetical protein [Kiritimatiellia bacterium]